MDAGERPADAELQLLGRDAELARLREAFDADRAVAVVGEAGIGKTTLVRMAVAASGRRLREGGGFATLNWLPYLALRRAIATGVGGDATSVAATLERGVGPDVLFVDDVQWVDDDTLAVLDLVIGRIMVVLAIRTGDAGSARAVELTRRGAVDRIELHGLSEAAAESLVHRAHPQLPAARTAVIVARAAGNPLLLEELALGDEPSPVLQRALAGQLDLLPSEARHAVDLLAVAERGLTRMALGSAVDAAIDVGIAVDTAGELQIRHVLVAEAIRSAIDAPVLAALNREVARLVHDPVDRARHLAAGGEADAATAAALAALDVVNDPRDRATLLAVAAETATREAGASLRLSAARALDELSEWSSVVRVLDDDRVDSEEQAVEREALLVHAHYALGEPDAARDHLVASEIAISAPSGATRRRAIEAATFLVNVDGDVVRALRILDAELARGNGSDPDGDLSVLRTAIQLLATGSGDPSIVTSGLDAAFAAGRYRTAADRARVIHYLLLMGASVEETLGFLLVQTNRFEAAGVGTVALEFAADAVRAAFLGGRLDDAIARGDDLAERPAPLRSIQASDVHRASALTLRGSFDRAAELFRTLASAVPGDFFGRGEVLAGQAELAFWSGRPSVAIDLATEALAIPAPVPGAHVPTMMTLGWARADLGLDPAILLPSFLTRSMAGAAHELEALGRWHGGDPAGATDSFDRAAEAWAGFWEPGRLRCQWAAGESVRRSGDREIAIDRLTTVREGASAIGFEPLGARIRRSLRLAGVRASATRTQVLAAGGLTARERELVGLVELGLTNVEIARRLGLGRPTVARILASAMTKLGVTTRAQLAAIAPD